MWEVITGDFGGDICYVFYLANITRCFVYIASGNFGSTCLETDYTLQLIKELIDFLQRKERII